MQGMWINEVQGLGRSCGFRPAAEEPQSVSRSESHKSPGPNAGPPNSHVKSQSGKLHANSLGPIFTFLRNH